MICAHLQDGWARHVTILMLMSANGDEASDWDMLTSVTVAFCGASSSASVATSASASATALCCSVGSREVEASAAALSARSL